ncbi:DUF2809 domain-containing protein [Aquimarina aquimarini]|uniref:ribosomal maturation YjgA family protein n=1 Tax=Aquimarina aquimarini TaxID=1191734 RepID=UPI000D552A04|nr:DUF2809 domain-containing protein [Aquimarina aquimarini]
MFRFEKKNFTFTVSLFLIEVIIAVFIDDVIIRPHIGDTIFVILLYCAVKSFFEIKTIPLVIVVLMVCYILEILQYFDIIGIMGLKECTLAPIILGKSFSWLDIIAYTFGAIVVIWFEKENNYNKDIKKQ